MRAPRTQVTPLIVPLYGILVFRNVVPRVAIHPREGVVTMKVSMTGVSGYIGGSIAAKLIASGHRVSGLVRDADKAARLRERGIAPVSGTLVDRSVLAEAAHQADAVINTADSDNLYAVKALLAALEGSGKCLLHTSGTCVIAHRA